MKITPYFPVSTPPTRPGVYLTLRPNSNCPFWRAFDGKNWYYGFANSLYPSPSYGESSRRRDVLPSRLVDFTWCGVAEEVTE